MAVPVVRLGLADKLKQLREMLLWSVLSDRSFMWFIFYGGAVFQNTSARMPALARNGVTYVENNALIATGEHGPRAR